ncbi:MAG: hypothetical protein Q7R33_01710 [Nitrosarchaeum sp.]|nr:hypothetical protein [Nitrosarchaeum sp.]
MRRKIEFRIVVDTCETDDKLRSLLEKFRDESLAIDGHFTSKGYILDGNHEDDEIHQKDLIINS